MACILFRSSTHRKRGKKLSFRQLSFCLSSLRDARFLFHFLISHSSFSYYLIPTLFSDSFCHQSTVIFRLLFGNSRFKNQSLHVVDVQILEKKCVFVLSYLIVTSLLFQPSSYHKIPNIVRWPSIIIWKRSVFLRETWKREVARRTRWISAFDRSKESSNALQARGIRVALRRNCGEGLKRSRGGGCEAKRRSDEPGKNSSLRLSRGNIYILGT